MIPPELPPPTLRLRLDGEALAANWRALDRLSGAAAAGAAVKADAYGLGIDNVVPVLRDAGAADFFVAHWSEAPALLRHVRPGQVAVLHGPLRAEDARFARATGVRPVINSLHQARLWTESGGGPCDLMVDTGINRLGLSPHETGDPLVGALAIDTLMSHLASADEDVAQNERQLALFEEICRQLPARRRSLANSAGIALGERYAFDLTRPGLSLYGGIPRPELAAMRQVAHPQAAVLQVRELSPGDSVGYNATFTAERPIRAATVSLGYADGFLRCWSGRGALRYCGALLPLLGRVSMDMVVVDCTAAPELREGDWLDVPYSLPESAARCGLSQYELLTLLGRRFRRGS
ncbi:MAG TPA: alanine racemase [Croceibacterium sp.]|nr:alanine racemase [Croceibacterium sp.]